VDGRRPSGVLYVNTDVDDPAKEAEYGRWYRDVHFPDVTEPGIFVNATLFHHASSPPPRGEGRFLAFYETSWGDVQAAVERFAEHVAVWVAERRIHPGTVSRSFGAYRQLAIELATARRRRSQSLVALHLDGASEAGAGELRRWWSAKHLAEVLAPGLFHTASLNELVRSQAFAAVTGDQAPFLALYESDFGDPRALAGEVVGRVRAAGLPEGVALRSAPSFHRASP
jgi:hypothetical protein